MHIDYIQLNESLGRLVFSYDKDKHCFIKEQDGKDPTLPMSVTLQITRRCNLECIYCSEDAQLKEYPLATVKKMIDNLTGVNRIIVSGGEPTLRRDLVSILQYVQEKGFPIVSIATNATRITRELAVQLRPVLTYADVTIDGTPDNHNRIRGQFEQVLTGLHNLIDEGIDVSLVNVLLSDNKSDLVDVCQMAENLGAKKIKVLSPIRKGRGAEILSKGLSSPELTGMFDQVKLAKKERGWKIKITITDWNIVNEGHAILIHPDGDIVASPVPTQPACIQKFGNIMNERIEQAWMRYPYVRNHLRKYFEESLLVC